MTREQIITRLLTLPAELAAAESTLFRAQQEATRAKDALQDAEDRLRLRGAIDGRNEAARAAQLRQSTVAQQVEHRSAQDLASSAAVCLRNLTNEFSALKAVARLVGGSG